MIIIAHRGLTDGPDKLLENTQKQVEHALELGYDVEIDVWLKDKKYFLGHDTPNHEVSWAWLTQSNMWIHCKNLPAFFDMRGRTIIHNYFWHESDAVILTNRNNVWTYYGRPDMANPESICVMPEVTYNWNEIPSIVNSGQWMGFCTDFPKRIEACLK
jgi:hypothetical protein